MIEELTKEQKAKLPEYAEEWLQIGLGYQDLDPEQVEAVIHDIYRAGDQTPPPRIIITTDPERANHMINLFEERVPFEEDMPTDLLAEKCREHRLGKSRVSEACYGGHDAAWLGFYEFWLDEVDVTACERLRPQMRAARMGIGWFWAYDEVAVVTPMPSFSIRDQENRLHNLDGPSSGYKDSDFCTYNVHGVRVEKHVVENKHLITVEQIESETNTEVRRVLTELYGAERYLQDSGAELVHEDDFGQLYRKEMPPGEETLMMVKVVNSTPEPDGTFKDYWLRVDPNAYGGLKTAQAAVASTWRDSNNVLVFERPEDYRPVVET
jgi:hypothetical protein